MIVVLLVAFGAGILTILSPCTLPMVPLVVGTTATGGRHRTAGVILGFGASFVAVTVLLASILAAAGVTTGALRAVSASLLGIAGAALVLPRVAALFERRLVPLVSIAAPSFGRAAGTGDGFSSGLALGSGIGLLWAPCVGPVMAAVIAVAAASGPTLAALAVSVSYVAGASLPLIAVARWGRGAIRSLVGGRSREHAQRVFGIGMVAMSLLIATGSDLAATAAVSRVLPAGWGSTLFAVEQQPQVLQELDAVRTQPQPTTSGGGQNVPAGAAGQEANLPAAISDSLPDSVALEDLGQAPELRGISTWINSSPLSIASLRGKVVLVHFWTFGCINCQNVQPYVKAWYERYASAGLVILGVHTPELSFERDVANVRDAVAKKDVRYPVAIDPDFATWNAYRNSYWPAFYFVDRSGRIRHVHFGEGDYDGSERVIRELLEQPG